MKQQIRLEKYQTDQIGMPTLQDIMKELDKPGRDPRSEIQEFSFNPDIHTIDDLQEGMILPERNYSKEGRSIILRIWGFVM